MDFRRSLRTLCPLLALTCLVQVWMVWRAVVPAQDSIRYLIVAQAMARDGLVEAIRSQPEQPLFPASVCLWHWLMGLTGETSSSAWASSLQFAAALPVVLSMVPVYLLFDRLHGLAAARIAAIVYGLLGGVARLGADGLSDSTHLLFFCLALWTAVEYFVRFADRRASPAWLLASGVGTGLALLTRAEAIVLPCAVLVSLAGFQCVPRWRQTIGQMLRATGAMLLGLSLPLVPYLLISPERDIDTLAARVLGRHGAIESLALNDPTPSRDVAAVEPKWHLSGVGQLVFGKKDFSTSGRFRGYLPAAAKLFEELAQSLHYFLGVLALVGLWASRRRLNAPLDRFMQLLCAALIAAALHVAARDGYLSTRHLLLLVVLALGWAGVGAITAGGWLAKLVGWVERSESHLLARRDVRGPIGANGGTRITRPTLTALETLLRGSIAIAAFASCLGDLLCPLHASRGAHRDAAAWLTKHAVSGDAVLDSRGWTALYTGRKTYRYEAAQAAFCDPALAYVVVEQAELDSPSRRGETLRALVAQAGEPAARFATPGAAKHGVAIYLWHPERFAELGVAAYAR